MTKNKKFQPSKAIHQLRGPELREEMIASKKKGMQYRKDHQGADIIIPHIEHENSHAESGKEKHKTK